MGGVKSKIKYSTRWHQLLYSLTGVFKPEYEPFEVCIYVQNKLSPPLKQRYFDDKGLYRFLLSGYNIPERVAECINGVYYLPEKHGQEEVSYDEFISGISNIENCIFKPSVGTDGGRGVDSFATSNGIVKESGIDVKTYISRFVSQGGKNFCIEKKIKECENLQCLNPTSCNSLRIHTYRNKAEGNVRYISSYIRIGKLGNVVDNAYSGGICGQIHEGGILKGAKTVYPYKVYNKTEAGVDISNYKIEGFQNMVNTVVKAHSNLPMFDLIGWDVAMDTDGRVVIIEFNPNPDVKMEQCIFVDTCMKGHQQDIVKQALNG